MPRPTALVATLLALCIAVSACSSDSNDSDRPDGPSGTVASPEATDQAAPTVMVGDHPHRPACRLFTPTDAVEVLRLAGEAEFDQQVLAESVTEEDGPDPDQVDTSLATTSCTYQLGDAADTTVRLDVKEYADDQQARAEWATIRRFGEERLPPRLTGGPTTFQELDSALRAILEDARQSVGGVRVPGFDDRILWRTGSTEFVATAGNLFLTFDRAENFGFTPDLSNRDVALAERVLLRAIERAADEATPSTHLAPVFGQDEDWPPFLDPCTLLDADGAEVLLGGRPGTLSTSSVDIDPAVNLGADSAAGGSHDNSCEWQLADRRGTADLNVQYVAPQDTAEEVLDSYLGNLAFGDPTPSRGQVDRVRAAMGPGNLSDVDASYVFVVGGQRSSFSYYLLLDRYVLELTGSLRRGKYGSRSVDTASLREAGQLVADHLAAAVADGSTG